jgi:hypothetical protein
MGDTVINCEFEVPLGSRPADLDAALAELDKVKTSDINLRVEIERLTRAVMAWKEVAEYRRKRIVDLKAELAAFIDPPPAEPVRPTFPANALRHSR